MKRIFLLLLAIVFISDACKKGENDPNFSFRTRKNRVTGRWQIKSGTSRYTETTSTGLITLSETFKFDETSYFYYDGNPYYYYQGGHSFNMEFDKKGNTTLTEVFDGISTSYYGNWDFNNGVGDKKKKEQLIIHFTSKTNHQGTYNYKGNLTDITYDITELRNDKMKLSAKYKTEYPDGTSAYYEDIYEMKQD